MRKPKTTATIAEAIAAKRSAIDNEAKAAAAPTVLRFVVPGEPVGKERARVFSKVNATGTVVTRAVTPEKTRSYESKVKLLAQIAVNQAKWAWSSEDAFTVILRIRHTHRKRHPDATNVFKAIEDGCNGVTWRDDVGVLDGAFSMRRDAVNPRVEVEIRRARMPA
jgi:Holliday junction resolvase RusA-like endonuclease